MFLLSLMLISGGDCVTLAQAPEEKPDTSAPAAAPVGNAENGKVLYDKKCVSCHGADGTGGKLAKSLKPKPTDLTASTLADTSLFAIVKNGGKSVKRSSLMQAYGKQFSDDEIRDIVAFMLSLREKK